MPQLPKVPKEARVRAILMPALPEHVAIVSKDVLQQLDSSDGEELRAEYRGRRAKVIARAGTVPADRVELHPNELKALGISDGTELFLMPSKHVNQADQKRN